MNEWVTARERELSECIVEGHLTHYKWYDYKHAHTTYTKQLTNNNKQTDKTKGNRRKKQTNKKRTKRRKEKNNNKNQHPTPPCAKRRKKATTYPRYRQHTSDTCTSKHCHIYLNTHYWGWGGGGGGGGGILTHSSLFLSRHQNRGREYTREITHILEITFKV